jgi:hypothetical protein
MEEGTAANAVCSAALAAGGTSSVCDSLDRQDRPAPSNRPVQSVREDTYSPELEAQDAVFTREVQADLRRQIADMEAGRNVVYNPRNRR